ncbi:MBL fold metallo-hydrolase [Paenibacillus sp. MMS20-IR301]|uniref:MBL fold metallo-hydrolase n=1 Tax=Paenibacillus sp. MMS20-IR301 TaxID=2895946 RepID=UPI0028E26BBF|nr:MBL fold metallo-hydrolase [Paenibacillus sp. MMS20-IR301]WNS46782.1 MBL fold metallo-hydrolase [Paenibacillus sp. MMS20-IR301]
MFQSRHFHILPIADGIYALEAAEQGGAMSNAGIIDLGGCTLIFDTFNTPQAGQDLRRAALHLLNQPVRYVVNSHWHGDHVRGNQMFCEETIIASNITRELMRRTQPEWLARMTPLLPNLQTDLAALAAAISAEPDEAARLRLTAEQAYLQEIRESIETLIVTYPAITYSRELTLSGSKRSVALRSLGEAHTACDTILYSPADSVVFAGDVIAVQNHPLFTDGNPQSWLLALDTLEKLGAQQIVPGHGPVSGAGSISSMRQYITDLLALRGEHGSSGDAVEISDIPVPAAYQDWKATGVFYRNLEFLLSQ